MGQFVKAATEAEVRIQFLENRESNLQEALNKAQERIAELEAMNPPKHTVAELEAAPIGSRLIKEDSFYGGITRVEGGWSYTNPPSLIFESAELLGRYAGEGWPEAKLELAEGPVEVPERPQLPEGVGSIIKILEHEYDDTPYYAERVHDEDGDLEWRALAGGPTFLGKPDTTFEDDIIEWEVVKVP